MTDKPQIFTEDYYRTLYESEERHWWCRGMRAIAAEMLLPLVRQSRPLAVLDAGCGTGGGLEWLRTLLGDGTYVGFDFVSYPLNYCRTRGWRNLARASIMELPFADGQFDVITSMDVFQHLPLPDGDAAAFRECHRILRPGGLLLLRSNARRLHDTDETTEVDFQRYTTEGLRARLESAGFKVERLTYVNRFDARMERSMAVQLLRSLKQRRATPERSQSNTGIPLRRLSTPFSWISELRYRLLLREARQLRKPQGEFAEGHSTLAIGRRTA